MELLLARVDKKLFSWWLNHILIYFQIRIEDNSEKVE